MRIEIGLSAAIIAISGDEPVILTARQDNGPPSLPYGPFDPVRDRTFENALRNWVNEQTGLRPGYVEQLYTFGDRGRHADNGESGRHVVSVGYLALAKPEEPATGAESSWQPLYSFLPWEDWRGGKPAIIEKAILPALESWASDAKRQSGRAGRLPPARARMRLAFGMDDIPWDDERVLDRYELMYEAGLVEEAARDGREPAIAHPVRFGEAMLHDHRRILATAAGRLRAKIKYRPVIFEMMPEEFTLSQLQSAVEAISGRHMHKQNFRRMVENAELVEPTGASTANPRGRPAALFRFRSAVLRERPAPGLKVGRQPPQRP